MGADTGGNAMIPRFTAEAALAASGSYYYGHTGFREREATVSPQQARTVMREGDGADISTCTCSCGRLDAHSGWLLHGADGSSTDAVDGFLVGHRVLICDRDSQWTDDFRRIVQRAGVRIVLMPVRAPNANAYAERFVRSIREECLDRLILFGERRLFRALDEFVAHYHGERNHQGLGNELIDPAAAVAGATRVRCRDRLGGLTICPDETGRTARRRGLSLPRLW
jgi:hypothetical protein